MSELRSCEDCALCCKYPALGAGGGDESGNLQFIKPMYEWCPYARVGQSLCCRVYEFRPWECRHFVCLWIAGILPDRLSPKKTKTLLFESGRTLVVMCEFRSPSNDFLPVLEWYVKHGFSVRMMAPGIEFNVPVPGV